jgi:hypothetical protein
VKRIALICTALLLIGTTQAFAQAGTSVYPVQALFTSEKVESSELFMKALSKDGSGKDRDYGIEAYVKKFKQYFPHAAATINDSNKYSTFAAFLQIPRVSLYRIQKTDKLVDLYLPVTVSINFANMVTGESLYSYTYTYYGKFETVSGRNEPGKDDPRIINLYRETYNDLLDVVLKQAQAGFTPSTINAKVGSEWNGNYILDRGMDAGMVKGDIIIDQHKNQLSVVHAAHKYSVAQSLLGAPKKDSVFSKYSNESMDELKKPKVMLLLNGNGRSHVKSSGLPDSVVYQLLINALGKRASFSLISVEKSYFDMQRAVLDLTHLKQEVTQNREVPDYFMKLYFHGPFYTNTPTNKSYASVDTYVVQACGSLYDRSGRVLYASCIDEKITDEVFGDIRFSNEAREEILIKNAIVRIADDFAQNVKFRSLEFLVKRAEGKNVVVEDKLNVLVPGQNVTLYRKVGKLSGISEDVLVPIWELRVGEKGSGQATLGRNLMLSPRAPEPVAGDVAMTSSMTAAGSSGAKVLKPCRKELVQDGGPAVQDVDQLLPFILSTGCKYPFYDVAGLSRHVAQYNDGSFGFKKKIEIVEVETDYCVEPVVKITKVTDTPSNQFTSTKYTLVGGVRIYKKDNVVWKKGSQQDITVVAAKGYEKPTYEREMSKALCGLMANEVVKKIEIGD